MRLSNAVTIRRRATIDKIVALVVFGEHLEILLTGSRIRGHTVSGDPDQRERARLQGTCSLCLSRRIREGMLICRECTDATSKRQRMQRKEAERG